MKIKLFDIDSWNEVFQTIKRNRKRSIMTALGVFWGTFMLVVLLGLGLGLGNFFRGMTGDMSTNSCFLMNRPTSIPYKGMPSGRWWNMTYDDVDNIRKIEGVKVASAYNWPRTAYASYEQKKGEYSISGCDSDYGQIDPPKILSGRFLNKIDDRERRKVCVIYNKVQEQLFASPADALGRQIRINNSYYTVVGVVKRSNSTVNFGIDDSSIVIPGTLFQQLYNRGNAVNVIMVAAYDNVNITRLQRECAKVIAANHLISPDDDKAVDGFNLGEMFGKFSGLFWGISLLTWIVGIGTLFAGLIGVSNIMLVVVRERTQEIGVRRALGASPFTIISQILSESFVLTFIAGIFGLASAVGVLSVVDKVFGAAAKINGEIVGASFQITFGLGIVCAAIVVAGSLLAGIIPANRALTIKAVDALREE